MSPLQSYEALSSSSSRTDVSRVLRSVIDAPPFTLTSPGRETLVQLLLDDIALCVGGGKHSSGRLTKKDAQLALLALKMLGRTTPCSRIIGRRENLTILLNAAEKLRSSESDAADESLRCIANALLLVDDARIPWVEIHGADHCVTLLEKSTSPNLIFLTCRILFLSTASSMSPFISTVLEPPRRRYSTSNLLSTARDYPHNDIIETISSKVDILLPLISQSVPMSKEALTDILKFSFNLLCHWPKISNDAESPSESTSSGKGKGKESKNKVLEEESPLGERWSSRLNGFLAPLRRAFLALPTGAPSPLAAPMTHILHSLLPIPISPELYTTWFPENSSPKDSSSKSDSRNHGPTSRSSSPGSSSSKDGKEGKEKERGGAFDRAMSMLHPRISLSSRPSSPGPSPTGSGPSAAAGGSSVPVLPMVGAPLGTPAVLTRAADLLNVSFEYYLPGTIDPDDKTVKQRCLDEDVELDHVLSPLVLLITKLVKYNTECRKVLREQLLPASLDRTTPLESRPDTLGRCLRLMSCVGHQRVKDSVGELLFILCDSDAQVLTAQIGYGNAAGYLFNRGLLAPPPAASDSSGAADSASSLQPGINPITGMVEQPREPGPEMTEEEKEREAEKLFVLFERLEKAGGMENPIKKAMREGKMEKYEEARRKKEEQGEDSD
ncbi:hypothetical protein SCHPADRAFT_880592 [Schizopora paradoxa]|uniref:Uncharacterized protein n=1 Tax=Schizopora paradoxa TaxID=27342 RepID=A0A0H2RAK3_9AGAM|nr:hypothetical protein SCHPADRAFT_880592 [Schizopora paradoxa]